MTNIEKAKAHFNYGVNCDIFSEPVRSYAKLAVIALEKQIPKKPLPVREVRSGRIISFTCPNCNHTDLGNNEYRFCCCECCGQALDWGEEDGKVY